MDAFENLGRAIDDLWLAIWEHTKQYIGWIVEHPWSIVLYCAFVLVLILLTR